MLFTPHWGDPVRHSLIDPVLLNQTLAERGDRFVLLIGASEQDRPLILRFLEQTDPSKYLHLSADSFRLLLWKYINFPRQAMREVSRCQTMYVTDLDTVFPPICQALADSFIAFFEDLPGTRIITTTRSRPHHILRGFNSRGYDYCVYRFVM